jgi:hypothetical protein
MRESSALKGGKSTSNNRRRPARPQDRRIGWLAKQGASVFAAEKYRFRTGPNVGFCPLTVGSPNSALQGWPDERKAPADHGLSPQLACSSRLGISPKRFPQLLVPPSLGAAPAPGQGEIWQPDIIKIKHCNCVRPAAFLRTVPSHRTSFGFLGDRASSLQSAMPILLLDSVVLIFDANSRPSSGSHSSKDDSNRFGLGAVADWQESSSLSVVAGRGALTSPVVKSAAPSPQLSP